MSIYIIAYDVADDGRRRRIARVLEQAGRRIQKSVFELNVDPKQLKALRRKLGPLLDAGDCCDIVPVDERGPRRRIAWMRPPDPFAAVLVAEPMRDGAKPLPGSRMFPRAQIKALLRERPLMRRVRYRIDGQIVERFETVPRHLPPELFAPPDREEPDIPDPDLPPEPGPVEILPPEELLDPAPEPPLWIGWQRDRPAAEAAADPADPKDSTATPPPPPPAGAIDAPRPPA